MLSNRALRIGTLISFSVWAALALLNHFLLKEDPIFIAFLTEHPWLQKVTVLAIAIPLPFLMYFLFSIYVSRIWLQLVKNIRKEDIDVIFFVFKLFLSKESLVSYNVYLKSKSD